MRPEGPQDAPIYLLGSRPSKEDDANDTHWCDEFMQAVHDAFRGSFMKEQVRSNYTVQCRGEEHVAVTECCRGRIEQDIEQTKPLVVVTVGDAPLKWATGAAGGAVTFRGSLFVAKFGTHVCYVYPLIFPNFIKTHRSKYETAFNHDIRWLKDNFDQLPSPKHYAAPYDTDIELITGDQPGDIHRLEKRLRQIAQYPHGALDLETTGLRPYMQRHPAILTAAVGTFEDTLAFPLSISSAGHSEGWGTQAREQRAMSLFVEYMQNSGRKACHNLAFEQEWIAHDCGPELLRRTEWDDTMAMAYVTDGRPGTKSLEAQTTMHFGFNLKEQSPVNVRLEQWWLKYPLKTILRYNGMDTKWTDGLQRVYDRSMDAASRDRYEQRIRLAPTLVLTEAPGLVFDEAYARKLDDEMRDRLHDVAAKIRRCREVQDFERKHGRFEPTAPEQVLKLMHGMLQRRECEREDRDGFLILTTDEEALSAIPSSEVPSAPLILEHREVAKIHGTYVVPGLQKKWICRDGLIRAKYSSMTAVSSRLAAEDPNVTNWPKRKHREVRGMVRARRKRWLMSADYGQIEFRVIGMASRDKNLVKYCWTGYDVHKYWAQRAIKLHGQIIDHAVKEFAETLALFKKKDGREYDEDAAILKLLRQEFKNKWVFPQFFGANTHSCAIGLHLPDDVAADLGAEFWDEFPDVKKWQQELIHFYEKHLYVETLGGFKRRGVMSMNEIINHPIQGTAAEIVQEAHMVLSELSELENDPELQPIINVHDDLTFDIGDDTLESKMPIIAREMCMPRFDYINVPLLVEVGIGERWDQMQELKVYRSHELFNIPNPYAEAT